MKAIINNLVYLGLAVIPFVLIAGYDSRLPKEQISILLSCVIALFCLFNGLLKPVKNKWLFITFIFILISMTLIPKTSLVAGFFTGKEFFLTPDINIDGVWNFKPVLYCLIYLLYFISVSSVEWNVKKTFIIISWVGAVLSCFAIIQYFGFNQFLNIRPYEAIGNLPHKEITATLGQPTILSAFLGLCLPFSLYSKRYDHFILSCVAILMTGSLNGIFAILLSFLVLLRNKFAVIVIAIVLFSLAITYVALKPSNFNGRIVTWGQTISDIKGDSDWSKKIKRPLTGYGLGAFPFISSTFHQSAWREVHNEYLQIAFSIGIIGLILFLCFLFNMFKDIFINYSMNGMNAIFIFLLIVCVSALSLFVFQLHAFIFYIVTILGISYSLKRDYYLKLGD